MCCLYLQCCKYVFSMGSYIPHGNRCITILYWEYMVSLCRNKISSFPIFCVVIYIKNFRSSFSGFPHHTPILLGLFVIFLITIAFQSMAFKVTEILKCSCSYWIPRHRLITPIYNLDVKQESTDLKTLCVTTKKAFILWFFHYILYVSLCFRAIISDVCNLWLFLFYFKFMTLKFSFKCGQFLILW